MVRFAAADQFSTGSADHSLEQSVTGMAPDGSPNPPMVSVVIPTYCEADSIVRTLKGLRDALADWASEIIVVDDNSPDGTADVVEQARVARP